MIKEISIKEYQNALDVADEIVDHFAITMNSSAESRQIEIVRAHYDNYTSERRFAFIRAIEVVDAGVDETLEAFASRVESEYKVLELKEDEVMKFIKELLEESAVL